MRWHRRWQCCSVEPQYGETLPRKCALCTSTMGLSRLTSILALPCAALCHIPAAHVPVTAKDTPSFVERAGTLACGAA